jgi:hypothetical protein
MAVSAASLGQPRVSRYASRLGCTNDGPCSWSLLPPPESISSPTRANSATAGRAAPGAAKDCTCTPPSGAPACSNAVTAALRIGSSSVHSIDTGTLAACALARASCSPCIRPGSVTVNWRCFLLWSYAMGRTQSSSMRSSISCSVGSGQLVPAGVLHRPLHAAAWHEQERPARRAAGERGVFRLEQQLQPVVGRVRRHPGTLPVNGRLSRLLELDRTRGDDGLLTAAQSNPAAGDTRRGGRHRRIEDLHVAVHEPGIEPARLLAQTGESERSGGSSSVSLTDPPPGSSTSAETTEASPRPLLLAVTT